MTMKRLVSPPYGYPPILIAGRASTGLGVLGVDTSDMATVEDYERWLGVPKKLERLEQYKADLNSKNGMVRTLAYYAIPELERSIRIDREVAQKKYEWNLHFVQTGAPYETKQSLLDYDAYVERQTRLNEEESREAIEEDNRIQAERRAQEEVRRARLDEIARVEQYIGRLQSFDAALRSALARPEIQAAFGAMIQSLLARLQQELARAAAHIQALQAAV